jgi:hypothetical protein
MSLATAKIVALSKNEADSFMSRYEHLGNVGLGVWHRGLIVLNSLASVLSFGTPCFNKNRGIIAKISTKHELKLVQLCRGATAQWAPKNTASRGITLALCDLQRELGPLLAVAYADPTVGEIGTIYQACNAICTGWTDPKGQAEYIINGKLLSGWLVRKRFGTRDRQKLKSVDPNLKIIPLKPKLRYVLVAAPPNVKRGVMDDLKTISIEYPKRDGLGIKHMRADSTCPC